MSVFNFFNKEVVIIFSVENFQFDKKNDTQTKISAQSKIFDKLEMGFGTFFGTNSLARAVLMKLLDHETRKVHLQLCNETNHN